MSANVQDTFLSGSPAKIVYNYTIFLENVMISNVICRNYRQHPFQMVHIFLCVLPQVLMT